MFSLFGGMFVVCYMQCWLELFWLLENIGVLLFNLMFMVVGNLFELCQVLGLCLIGLCLLCVFVEVYFGFVFGIVGMCKLIGVIYGLLIGIIIKFSIGLLVEEMVEQVCVLVVGGIDFIKDDELQVDGGCCFFDEWVCVVMWVVNEYVECIGKKVMVVFNLIGDFDQMCCCYDLVLVEGGICVMVVLNFIGLVGLQELCCYVQLLIYVYCVGWGYFMCSL